MNQDNLTEEILNDNIKPKLPTGLNILTILTFIGCGLQLIGALWSFFTAKSNYEKKEQIIAQMNSEEMPGWAKSMMGDPAHFEALVTKSYENRIPILLLTLVAVILCIVGAVQMRKLKKQGFAIYTIGELLPFLVQFLFIGAFSFTGIWLFVGVGITFLFLLLYYLQRKNLVY